MRTVKQTILAGLAVAAIAASAPAAKFSDSVKDSFVREIPIAPNGVLVVDNRDGSIEITSHDAPHAWVGVQRITRGVDAAALTEGRNATRVEFGGNAARTIIRTVNPLTQSGRWQSIVSYTIRVPRTVSVKLASHWSERIRVANLAGSVSVSNVIGPIYLENLTGALSVESINGTIFYDSSSRPGANVRLQTVNGNIEMVVVPNANFRWVASTIRGDFLTNFPVNGHFDGSTFRGAINSARGPMITTAALMGNVTLVRKGTNASQARSVRLLSAPQAPAPPSTQAGPVLSRTFSMPHFQGNLSYETNVGNVLVGEVRGDARIRTGAGEVKLGNVHGDTIVVSHGGPLEFGDLTGPVRAETKAGDITVRVARAGGTLTTGGGIIRVFYAHGALTMRSGGGDIFVRQASGPISAETRSGDITINFEAAVQGLPVEARTGEGNVLLNVSPQFAADIEAIVMTSDEEANSIASEFPDVTIQRDRVGGRTRIRATGKVNGGGQRVSLYAEEGNIHIKAQAIRPLLSPAQ